MKDKLIKTSFLTEKDWNLFQETLYIGEGEEKRLIDGIISIHYLAHLQLPPDADWEPDPDNPEDNGWRLSDDYAADILVKGDFDYSSWSKYIANCPSQRHIIPGCICDVICNNT